MLARIGNIHAGSLRHTSLGNRLLRGVRKQRRIYPLYSSARKRGGKQSDLAFELAHIALCLIGEGKVHYKRRMAPRPTFSKPRPRAYAYLHPRGPIGYERHFGHDPASPLSTCTMPNAFSPPRHPCFRPGSTEIADSFDDYMSVEENICRPQSGQQVIARWLRQASQGSRHLQKREHELYDPERNRDSYFEHKVQAYYSLRCIPQIYGPVYTTFPRKRSTKYSKTRLNSACDNPIVDYTTKKHLPRRQLPRRLHLTRSRQGKNSNCKEWL